MQLPNFSACVVVQAAGIKGLGRTQWEEVAFVLQAGAVEWQFGFLDTHVYVSLCVCACSSVSG